MTIELDYSTPAPMNCKTCANRLGPYWMAQCLYSGKFASITRQYGPCGKDWAGWQPRQGVLTRVVQFFKGVK